MYGALHEIEQRVGHEKFPLIQQYYYPSLRSHGFIVYYLFLKTQGITPNFPLVVKVAHPHAGCTAVKKFISVQVLARCVSTKRKI